MARSQSILRLVLSLFMIALLSQSIVNASAAPSKSSVPDLDIVLVTDESTTMWQENDSDGWRIVMDDLFVDMLGVDQSGANHQLTAVMFGNEAKLVQPLGSVSSPSQQNQLKGAINGNHIDSGGTNFIAALQRAISELVSNGRPDSKKAIVFLTDGRCELQGQGDAGTDRCNQDVRALVNQYADKVKIYSIAYTEAAFQQDPKFGIYKSLLQEISGVTGGKYFESEKSEQGLLKVYMAIIQDLMGMVPTEPEPPIPTPNEIPFKIEEGYCQVIFTVVKYNAGIDTFVIDPGGVQLDGTSGNVRYATSGKTDTYSITNPQAGQWTIKLNGQGSASVIKNILCPNNFKVKVKVPGNTHPAGKPMNILVQVVDTGGNVVSVNGLKASLSVNDQPVKDLDFAAQSDNIYQSTLDDTTQPGNYTLAFTSQQDNPNLPVVEDSKTILVVRAPWVKIIEPQAGASYPMNQPVNARVQMMFGTTPVEKPEESDMLAILASVVDEQLQAMGGGPMKVGEDGVFTFPFTFDKQFNALLSVNMSGKKSTGEDYLDTDEVSFVVGESVITPTHTFTPTPTKTPTPTPVPAMAVTTPTPKPPVKIPPGAIAGGLGGLLLLAGAGGAVAWWMLKPSMVGMINAGSSLVPLAGKRPMYVGSDPRAGIPLMPEEGVLPRHAQVRPIGSRKNPQVEIVSLDPNNPVVVNGMQSHSHILQNGDKIQIGSNEIEYTGPETVGNFDFNQTQPTDYDFTQPNF